MFSEIIKREITKLMLAIFVYTNLSPAFCMQGMSEYVVNVKRTNIQNDTTQEITKGFAIQVLQRQIVQQVAQQANAMAQAWTEKILFEKAIYPFIVMAAYNAAQMTAMAKLTEILQNVKVVGEEKKDQQLDTVETKEMNTLLSRGFCLSIDGLGDLLLTNDGDIVLSGSSDTPQNLSKSLKVISPSLVVLDNVIAKSIDVESTAAVLTSGKKAIFEDIHFRSTNVSNEEDSNMIKNSLIIEKNSELEVGNLNIENALLVNDGNFKIKNSLNFNKGALINAGIITTTADPTTIRGLSYLLNNGSAEINASGKLILGSQKIINHGTFNAKNLSITTADVFENHGGIKGTETIELIANNGIDNEGTIEAKKVSMSSEKQILSTGNLRTTEKLSINSDSGIGILGEVSGKNGSIELKAPVIEQAGETLANKVILTASESLVLDGNIGAQELFLTSKEIHSKKGINTQRGVIDGNFYGSGANAFAQQLEIIGTETKFVTEKVETGTLINRGQKTVIVGGEFSNTTELQNESGSLVFNGTKLPKLKSFTNRGDLGFSDNSELPNLERFSTTSQLSLAAASPLSKLTEISFDGNSTLHANLPNVTKITINGAGNLTTTWKSSLPKLKQIDNYGTAKITTNVGLLDTIYHGSSTSQTQIESYSAIPGIKSLNLSRGKLFMKASMANLKSIEVQKGAEFTLMPGGMASNLTEIKNHGSAVFNAELMNLQNLYNDKDATLHLLDKVKLVGGEKKNKDTMLLEQKSTLDAISWIDEFKWMEEKKFENIPSIIAEIFNSSLISQNITSERKAADLAKGIKDDTGRSYAVWTISIKEMLKNYSLPIKSTVEKAAEICEKYGIAGAQKFITDCVRFLNAINISECCERRESVTAEYLKKETHRWRDSFANTAKIMEEEFKGGQPSAPELIRNKKPYIKTQSNINYILTQVAAKELAKNPILDLRDAIETAAQICRDNGLQVYNQRLTDVGIYLGKMDVESYAKQGHLVNNGKMLIQHKKQINENSDYQDLEVKGKYIGSENSVLRYENGAHTLCDDYVNNGVFYSPNRFRFIQHGTVTKWGKAVAENGIIYEIDGGIKLSTMTLQPLIKDQKNGTFTIKSKGLAEIDRNIEVPYRIRIEAPNIDIKSEFLTRILDIETPGLLHIYRGGIAKASEYAYVKAGSFFNDGGKIQANRNITMNILGNFTNTGGMSNIPQKKGPWSYKTTSKISGDPKVDEHGRYTEVELVDNRIGKFTLNNYTIIHEKAGFVGCGGDIDIIAESFANDFGIIRASGFVKLKAQNQYNKVFGDISNRCGVIYSESGGELIGRNLYNGYAEQGRQIPGGVNPLSHYEKYSRIEQEG